MINRLSRFALGLLILASLVLTGNFQVIARSETPLNLHQQNLAPALLTGSFYSQPVDPAGSLIFSSWRNPDGSNYDQYVWENFTLLANDTISQIDWTGGYDPTKAGSGGPVLDFQINIYPSIPAGTEPAVANPPLVSYMVGGNAGETSIGTVGSIPMYSYSFTLPASFAVTAGVKYWVQIEATQQGSMPDWGLAAATGGNGYHYQKGSGAGGDVLYRSATGDVAFALSGTISTDLPGLFNKTSPANNVIDQATSLTLAWGSSTGAASYEYCLDTTGDCTIWTDNGTLTSVTINGLSTNTTYYWHVRANNSNGTTYSNGTVTDAWSFTTLPDPPAAFAKTSPADLGSVLPASVPLTWDASTGAVSYEYCFDTTNDSACSTWISSGAATSATINGLFPNTAYYWQVRAINSGGTVIADSGTWWSFTTQTATIYTSTIVSTAAQDGWVLEYTEKSGLGRTVNTLGGVINIGDDSMKRQYRGILSFNTGMALPDNAIVTRVTLRFKKQSITGTVNPFYALGGMMVDVKNGFIGPSSSLTSGDFQAWAHATYGPFYPAIINTWYSIDLSSARTTINSLSGNYGLTQFRLRFSLDDNNNGTANQLRFYSGNYATRSYRPVLLVEYYLP